MHEGFGSAGHTAFPVLGELELADFALAHDRGAVCKIVSMESTTCDLSSTMCVVHKASSRVGSVYAHSDRIAIFVFNKE